MLLCSSILYYKLLTDFVCIRYGDKCPKSVIARLFSIIWILLGLVIMAMFTANITSALTALSLQLEPSSLVGVKVGLILSQLAVFVQLYLSLCVRKRSLRVGCVRQIGQISIIPDPRSLDYNARRKSLRDMLAFVMFLYGYLRYTYSLPSDPINYDLLHSKMTLSSMEL